jgi:crotonobetainyl-CoA:carnitine CoA-transferase CaiB-like acyl-CoA transferase
LTDISAEGSARRSDATGTPGAATAPADGAAGPLAGIRVLDCATLLAGPMVATLLGDMGAEVVKVEHPKGDPLRGHGPRREGQPLIWKVANRNKSGITLNLSREADAAAFRAMAADTDVIVENFRPGTLERWGVGWDVLHEINPRLVLVRVTGFGQTGPYAPRPGFGTLAEAMSGFAHVTGAADGPPTLPPFGLADGICGITGAWSTTAALYWRDVAGGEGQVVDLSLYEPLMSIVGVQATIYDQTGVVQGRNGNRSVNNAPRNTYETADGRWVAVSTSADTIAVRLMELIGRGDLAAQPWFAKASGRIEHVEEVDGAVADWIRGRDADEVVRLCEEAGAAVMPVYTAADLVADPHLNERGTLRRVADPDLGDVLVQDVIARLSESPGAIRTTGPKLGEHNGEVLGERYGVDLAALDG